MSKEKSPELLPCPFCGEKKFLEVYATERKDRPKCIWTAKVVCLICHGQITNHGFDWTEEEAKERAIKAWNSRTHEPN